MTLRPLRLLIVAIALVGLSLPAAAVAGSRDKGADRGVVQSVDSAQIVLRTLDGRVATFGVPPGTTVRLNRAHASLTDIHPGYVAHVVYDRKSRAVLVEAFGATPATTTTDRGVVTAVTRSTITLRTDGGAIVTVAVDAGTRFRFHGSPALRQLVRPGAEVAVTHASDAPAVLVKVLKRTEA